MHIIGLKTFSAHLTKKNRIQISTGFVCVSFLCYEFIETFFIFPNKARFQLIVTTKMHDVWTQKHVLDEIFVIDIGLTHFTSFSLSNFEDFVNLRYRCSFLPRTFSNRQKSLHGALLFLCNIDISSLDEFKNNHPMYSRKQIKVVLITQFRWIKAVKKNTEISSNFALFLMNNQVLCAKIKVDFIWTKPNKGQCRNALRTWWKTKRVRLLLYTNDIWRTWQLFVSTSSWHPWSWTKALHVFIINFVLRCPPRMQ